MIIVLDNAESILDPQGTNAEDIHALVDELSRLETICLCITSRVSTGVPTSCETLDIPSLSAESARDTFYQIYKNVELPDSVDEILEQVEFHPLSITLLATVAHQNGWDTDRLAKEWKRGRTGLPHTQHNKSLAATIELSLASPMFQELGPDARGLLGVVAFSPQGIDEKNMDRLFPTISDRSNIFNKFHALSLVYQSDGFITMLAPLRDHLRPDNPYTSPLLRKTMEHYFTRLSTDLDPGGPNFGGTQWIASEDVNVEHLLDVFTGIDAYRHSDIIWEACVNFMYHLCRDKRRPIILGPRIQELPDCHPSKPECLYALSCLSGLVGNWTEYSRLLAYALVLWKEDRDDDRVGQTLSDLPDSNWMMDLYQEAIRQAREALGTIEQLGDTVEQAQCLINLAWLLRGDKQLDTAEKTALRAIDLLSEKGDEYLVFESHLVLAQTYRSKGDIGKAVHHHERVLEVASSSNWHDRLFWTHYDLGLLFRDEGKFDDAITHVEYAMRHMPDDDGYHLGCVMRLRATVSFKRGKLGDAMSEARSAVSGFGKVRATKDLEHSRPLLQQVEEKMDNTVGPWYVRIYLWPAANDVIFCSY